MLRIVVVVVALAYLPVRCAGAFCKGLMVGSSPGFHDIVEDGLVNHDFSFDAEAVPTNTYSGEDIIHNFYIKKEGTEIKLSATVESTTTFAEDLMYPEITGDLFDKQKHKGREDETVNATTTDLIVNYHCTDVGGTSIVWIKLDITAEQHQAACGPLAGYRDLQIFVLWTKYCSPKLVDRSGLSMGTREGGSDIAFNGQTRPEWQDLRSPTTPGHLATEQVVEEHLVLSAVTNTTFFLQTNDSSTQVFGKPKFEYDKSKLIVSLFNTFHGGTAGSEGGELIIIEYLCSFNSDSPVEITMIIDLCDDLVQPKDCREENNVGFEPLIVQWTKNCGVDDGSLNHGLNTPQTVAIVLVMIAFGLCVIGAFVRYFKWQKRGADIIPGGLFIESMAYMCWALTCRRSAYSKPRGNDDTTGINLAIGKTKSSTGEITVQFESKAKSSVSSAKSGFQASSGSSSYGAATGSANPFQKTVAEDKFDEADI